MKKTPFLIWGILCCLLLPACKKHPAQPAIYTLTLPLAAIPTPQYPACPLRDDVAWQTWKVASNSFAVHGPVVDEQRVWFSDDFGTYRIDTQTGEYARYPELPNARLFLPVGEGKVWLISGSGPLYFDGQAWIQPALDPSSTSHNGASRMGVDRNGNLWFLTAYGRGAPSISQYPGHIPPEGETWKPLPYSDYEWDVYNCEWWQAYTNGQITYHSGEECQQLREVAQQVEILAARNVFATNGQDVWWVAADGQVFQATDGVTKSIFIPADAAVSQLVADSNRGVWVGTSHGLFYADEAGARWFEQTVNIDACTLPDAPIDMAIDARGDVWLTTFSGLLKFSRSGTQWERVFDAKVSDVDRRRPIIKIAAAPDGDIWATHGWDLWKVNETPPASPAGLNPSCRFNNLTVDTYNNVWVSSSQCGVWQYSSGDNTWIAHSLDDAIEWVTTRPDGAIYAAGDDSLFVYTGTVSVEPMSGEKRRVWNPVILDMDLEDISSGQLNIAVNSRGGVWINTRNGQVWYMRERRWVPLEGAPLGVTGLYIDAQDRLWMQTGKNLAFYDGERIAVFSTPLDFVIKMAFGPDGRVWVIGTNKVAVYNPNAAGQP